MVFFESMRVLTKFQDTYENIDTIINNTDTIMMFFFATINQEFLMFEHYKRIITSFTNSSFCSFVFKQQQVVNIQQLIKLKFFLSYDNRFHLEKHNFRIFNFKKLGFINFLVNCKLISISTFKYYITKINKICLTAKIFKRVLLMNNILKILNRG